MLVKCIYCGDLDHFSEVFRSHHQSHQKSSEVSLSELTKSYPVLTEFIYCAKGENLSEVV